MQRQANTSERVPAVYLKTLTSLEASINTAVAKEKEAKKKMNAANFRALSGAKQKVKRAQKEYETSLKQYQDVRVTPF